MNHSLFLKNLEEAALELTQIPLWGTPPLFPYEKFSNSLSKALGIPIHISEYKTEWKTKKHVLDGMGQSPLMQPFCLSPLPGVLFWVMPKTTHEKLLQHLLKLQDSTLSDSSLQEGFTTYVFLYALERLNTLNPYGNLTIHLSETNGLTEEGAIAIDVAISFEETPLWGRILIPQETHSSFKAHFTMQKPPLLTDPKFSSLPLVLHLQIGSTTLPSAQWEKISIGDFLVLDRCTYDVKGKGTAILTLNATPLFEVRIKEGQAKILEYALMQEVSTMSEEDSTQKDEKEITPQDSQHTEEKDVLSSAGHVPIHLTIEIARIQMPLEQVTQLKPGNVLNLGIGLQPDVHIVASGKRVARAELVKLGDVLGVKILKLGE